MQENEHEYYEKIGNWEFDKIKYKTEKLTDWDFYEKIKEYTDKKSVCLDLGTGGGEKVLKYYPEVGKIYGTDFAQEMIKTAKENAKMHPNRNVEFLKMDNLNMEFPDKIFDLISARHTIINAKQIYNALKDNGILVVEGVNKKDCWELKKIFGRGQAFFDKVEISEKDYNDLKEVGFTKIELFEVLENEYYETEEDLLALLLKTPILDDFSEEDNSEFIHKKEIEKDLFDEYVNRYKTNKGILLKRVLYGIVAMK